MLFPFLPLSSFTSAHASLFSIAPTFRSRSNIRVKTRSSVRSSFRSLVAYSHRHLPVPLVLLRSTSQTSTWVARGVASNHVCFENSFLSCSMHLFSRKTLLVIFALAFLTWIGIVGTRAVVEVVRSLLKLICFVVSGSVASGTGSGGSVTTTQRLTPDKRTAGKCG